MSRPLRIAVFVGAFPVVSETFIVRQITGLIDLGHEVDIYANLRVEAGGPIQPDVAKYNLLSRTTYVSGPVESVQWEMPVWPLTGLTWPPGAEKPVRNFTRLTRALPALARCGLAEPRLARAALDPREYGYEARSLSAIHRLATLCGRRGTYDVLHAHFGTVARSFRFARELWQAPLVASFHGYDFTTAPRKEGAGMYERLFAACDAVTVNSAFTRGRVGALGCPDGKMELLPVGVNLEEFAFRERRREEDGPVRLLTVARLVEIKGHEFLIRAMAELRTRRHACRLDIVGDGPLRRKLEELSASLGLRESVVFRGAQPGPVVRQLMTKAHLFVLGSVSVAGDEEGQGLVLQEAQAAGLPVVTTRHGALPEGMLEGKSGFVVPERDVDALTDRLNHLIEHPELWAEFGRCGRKFVEEKYDIRKLNGRLAEIYEHARKSCPLVRK